MWVSEGQELKAAAALPSTMLVVSSPQLAPLPARAGRLLCCQVTAIPGPATFSHCTEGPSLRACPRPWPGWWAGPPVGPRQLL